MPLKIFNIFTREYRVLAGNLEFKISTDRKWKKCNTLGEGRKGQV